MTGDLLVLRKRESIAAARTTGWTCEQMPPSIITTAGALLVNDRGDILFGLRAAWKTAWPGHWDGIGGRVEPGERLEDALIREVQEEIGVTPIEFAWLDCIEERRPVAHGQHLHHIYMVTAWRDGDPANICDEHSEIRWFNTDELLSLDNLADCDYPRFARLISARKRSGPGAA